MGKLNINNGGVDTNKKMPDIDERFGPYTSAEAANAALGSQGRNTITAGLTVGILTANAGVKEYWYQPNKTTGQLELIPKGGNAADNTTEGNFASFDKNGNVVDSGNKTTDFATAVQGAKADSAVQSVEVGTTTTGEAGTDASVTNSGTSTAPVLDFTIPRGADAVNPFKGWFTTANIPTTGQEGDYCNVSNTSVTPHTVTIYRWSTAQNAFVDTGEVPDTANGETFASSEELNQVAIDDSHLDNPVNKANATQPVLAKAEDVMQLKAKLEGVTASETKVSYPYSEYKVNNKSGYYYINNNNSLTWFESTAAYKSAIIPVNGYGVARFLAPCFAVTSASPRIVWLDSSQNVLSNEPYDTDASLSGNISKNTIRNIPTEAYYMVVYLRYSSTSNPNLITQDTFYCYLKSGKDVNEVINEHIKESVGVQGTVTMRYGKTTISNHKLEMEASDKLLFSTRYINYDDVVGAEVGDGYSVMAIYFDESLDYVGQSTYNRTWMNDATITCKYILLSIKKTDNSTIQSPDDVALKIIYRSVKPINLENIKVHGKDLKYLFVDSNMVVNGDLLQADSGWTNTVSPIYDNSDLSISKSYRFDFTSSYRRFQSLALKEGHKYVIACECKIDGINDSKLTSQNNVVNFYGETLADNRSAGVLMSKTIGFARFTNGYKIALGEIEIPVTTNYGASVNFNFNIGNMGINGMISGYVRNAVCIDLTEISFASNPTRKELFNAYANYISYLKCGEVAIINSKIESYKELYFSDTEAKRAFMDEENKIVEELGCSQTHLFNPSGVYYVDHKTTAKDFIKIGAASMTENSFLRIINIHSMDVPVIHNKTVDGVVYKDVSDVIVPTEIAEYSGAEGEASEVLNENYEIVAAKTGSWNGDTNPAKTQTLVMVVRSKSSGRYIAGYIHNGGTNYSTTWNDNKYAYIKNLFDKVEDDSVVLSLGTTSEWSAGYITETNQWAKYVDFGTVKQNDTVQFPPASTTKFITCIVALQHLKENEIIEYSTFDFSTGSGASITGGDKFKLRDAIYLCMASSSNSLANTIARYCGHRLLNEQYC